MSIIEDGTGKGYKLKINDENQAEVSAIVVSEAAHRSEDFGASYLVATGDYISLTSGESAVLYLKYTGEKHLHVSNLRTCGTGVQKWKFYVGTSAGTIVSGASAATKYNTNLNSSNSLSADSYKGADGNTQTGGVVYDQWINNGGHSVEDFDGAFILGKNDSICLTCEVTTSVDVCARMLVYESEVE